MGAEGSVFRLRKLLETARKHSRFSQLERVEDALKELEVDMSAYSALIPDGYHKEVFRSMVSAIFQDMFDTTEAGGRIARTESGRSALAVVFVAVKANIDTKAVADFLGVSRFEARALKKQVKNMFSDRSAVFSEPFSKLSSSDFRNLVGKVSGNPGTAKKDAVEEALRIAKEKIPDFYMDMRGKIERCMNFIDPGIVLPEAIPDEWRLTERSPNSPLVSNMEKFFTGDGKPLHGIRTDSEGRVIPERRAQDKGFGMGR